MHFRPDSRERFALNCVSVIHDMMKDPKRRDNLNGGPIASIVTALVKGAYLGLDFMNGECYAIPYKGKNGNPGTMNFQTDYKGEIKLCKKYSKNKIKDIFAKIVRRGDEFYEEVDSGVQKVYFKPQPFSDGEILGAFAVATFFDGSMIYDTMSTAEIEKVRKTYSRAPDSQAWKESPGEMYKKTVLRRLCKLIDLDFDNIEQQKAFDAGGDANFIQIQNSNRPTAALPENEKPMDVTEQIRNAKAAKAPDPVPVEAEVIPDEEYARYEQQ